MQPVRIDGVGLTPLGVHPNRTGRELFAEAADRAFQDADVPRDDVDFLCLGNFVGDVAEQQGHQGPLMADAAGVSVPATRFENACASGGFAIRGAVQAIQNDNADVVLVGGVEKLTNLGTGGSTEALAMAADDLFESRVGLTFPGAYALLARAYFEEHGGSREDLAAISVKNHANAVDNEYAQFRHEVSVDDVLDAPTIADPLGLYDACPVTDGAAAAILVSQEYSETHGVDAPVAVTGSGQGGDTLALQDRDKLTRTPAAEWAAERAYDEADITPTDVDIAEVHDCFTIAEVLAIEALGFYEPGTGISAAANGETTVDGRLPVNLSGGLKAKGHPVGATGVAQLVELTRLLRGDHPKSDDVSDARVAVAHNAGGTVASAVVHVVEVDT
ncbi:thiolase domain-containing protein [Haloferax sp. AB510]|uniref:thiolase domain-containing protein n=1 Tax=Haloferax sp. AB510 TaxID=2934172 RepID=UPI00209BDD4D|nr:thiolase domain-containing protein [Haloferax sp. AB510]MCO8268790.1 thiolase domain-containing protein [Haloferax sp. AB510]